MKNIQVKYCAHRNHMLSGTLRLSSIMALCFVSAGCTSTCRVGGQKGQSNVKNTQEIATVGPLRLEPGEMIAQHSVVDAQFTMTSTVDGAKKVETPPPSKMVADTELYLDSSHGTDKSATVTSGTKFIAVRGRGGELVSVGDKIDNPIVNALKMMTLYLQLDESGRATSVSGYDKLFDDLRETGLSESAIGVLKTSIVSAPEQDETLLSWNSSFVDMVGQTYVPGRTFSASLTRVGLLGTVSMKNEVVIRPVKEGCPSHDCLSVQYKADPVTETLLESSNIRIDEALQINTATPMSKGGIKPDADDKIVTRLQGERIHDRQTMQLYSDIYTINYDIDVVRPADKGGPLHWAYTEKHNTSATVSTAQ